MRPPDPAPDDERAASPQAPDQAPRLGRRVLTSLLWVPLAFVLAFLGGWPFTLGLSAFAAVGLIEFYAMEQRRGLHSNRLLGLLAGALVLLAFHLEEARLWQAALLLALVWALLLEWRRKRPRRKAALRVLTTLGGIVYVAFPFAFLIAIRRVEPDVYGIHWIFAVIGSTWGTDIFSFVFGKLLGRTPLAPQLSPGKTVEGALAGIVFGALLPSLVMLRIEALTLPVFGLFLVAPVLGIAGDLFESGVKRYFGVKDSHVAGLNLVPGHGGVLDRFDAALWIVSGYYGYLVLAGEVPLLM